jgi:hypothetical protein
MPPLSYRQHEVSFCADVSKWSDRIFEIHPELPFGSPEIERFGRGSLKRQDLRVCERKEGGPGKLALCGEVKLPGAAQGSSPFGRALMEDAFLKATREGCRYFFTWNLEFKCMPEQTAITPFVIFRHCVDAIAQGALIRRVSSTDKEFHFQNWFKTRLEGTGLNVEEGGRNSYPDFRIVAPTEGYEVKGLAYPGRYANFDSNSQAPTGFHNGRTIYYVFGRYPKKPDGNTYPVLDLVICHGDFLNAHHEYKHKNKSVKGFGTYGDIMIRDRKMYVVPTPFHLVQGVAHIQTLILPAEFKPGPTESARYIEVGKLSRFEAAELIIGYSFNLQTNDLVPQKMANPAAGREHRFRGWRLKGSSIEQVSMAPLKIALDSADEEEDE